MRIVIGLVFLLCSCKTTFTSNDVDSITSNDFYMQASSCGCFGCGEEFIEVYRKSGKRWMEVTAFPEKTTTLIELTPEKDKALHEFIRQRVKSQTDGALCTTTTEWRIWNEKRTIHFTDGICAFPDFNY